MENEPRNFRQAVLKWMNGEGKLIYGGMIGLAGAMVLGLSEEDINNLILVTREFPLSLGAVLTFTREIGIQDWQTALFFMIFGSLTAGSGLTVIQERSEKNNE